MAYKRGEKKIVGDDDFVWVRSIYGKGPDAHKRYHFIPSGGMNKVIEDWHKKQEARIYDCATPSRITQCPRAVWLHNHGVEKLTTMGWGVEQRLLLGRAFEDKFAEQLHSEGLLIHHWKDNDGDVVDKFKSGTGIDRLEGVPDYLLKLNLPTVSDAKTSRSDSFGYVPIEFEEAILDYNWWKYKVQLNAYFKLCIENKGWFTDRDFPLPEQCHLFSYALDDGIVRREFTWTPTSEDLSEVVFLTRRFNEAITASKMPDCTCRDMADGQMKFCPYGTYDKPGDKVCSDCCDPDLVKLIKTE